MFLIIKNIFISWIDHFYFLMAFDFGFRFRAWWISAENFYLNKFMIKIILPL